MHAIAGPVVLSLVSTLILINCLAMLHCVLKICLLCFKRVYGAYKQRKQVTRKLSLVEDIEKIAIRIDKDDVFSAVSHPPPQC